MEFLAQEVLVEAISKLAALSSSKMFVLVEDSLSNRCFAGADDLCAAFSAGSLARRESDAKVKYDINDRRYVKAVGEVWVRGGGGGRAGSAGAGGAEFDEDRSDGGAGGDVPEEAPGEVDGGGVVAVPEVAMRQKRSAMETGAQVGPKRIKPDLGSAASPAGNF